MGYKLRFPTQKRILIGLLVAWAFVMPFGVTAILEMLSDIKYAPVESYYTISGIGLACNLPVLFYALRRALPATCDPQLMVPVLAGMLLPVVLSAAPHYINLSFAAPQVYNISVPIAEKSRLRRTPRDSKSFLVYKLHLQFDNMQIADRILDGQHIVFVPKETYDRLSIGDTFDITLQNALLAPFMLQTDATVNMMR